MNCTDFDKLNTCPNVSCDKVEVADLRKVVIEAVKGTDAEGQPFAPKNGAYRNSVVYYEQNGHTYLYGSDGIPTLLNSTVGNVDFEDVKNRPKYAGSPMDSHTEIPKVPENVSELNNDSNYATVDSVNSVKNELAAEIVSKVETEATARNNKDVEIEGKLNKTVVSNINMDTTASTTTVKLKEGKVNIGSGATSTEELPLPVASDTQAGIMNAATYKSITENSNRISNIERESVAISGLAEHPSQAQLTSAWKEVSGETELQNGASIWCTDWHKRYEYFTNQHQWVITQEGLGGEVTISQWTNSAAGIAKGSTEDGQIFAETDGTGSVNGWDALTSTANTAKSKAEALESNKQDKLTAGDNITIENNVISTQGSVWTESPISTEEAEAVVGTNMIQDNAVTTDKINAGAVTNDKIAAGAVKSDNIDWTTLREIIYDNPSGTIGNFTLTHPISEYRWIEVFFKDDQSFSSSVSIHTDYTQSQLPFIICIPKPGAALNVMFMSGTRYKINGTSVAVEGNMILELRTSGIVMNPNSGTNNYKVTAVIGYR